MHLNDTLPNRHICPQCGVSFVRRSWKGYDPKYCSPQCSYPAKNLTAEQFWAKVIRAPGDGCWLWQGGISKSGYGKVKMAKRDLRSHRVAYELTYGPIPNGLLVCHSCDRNYPPGDISYRRCCRPDHLFLGTDADNMRDAAAKGRMAAGDRHARRVCPERSARGERVNTATLTTAKVIEIRHRARGGESASSLAREFGVTKSGIQHVVWRLSWAHVSDDQDSLPLERQRLAPQQLVLFQEVVPVMEPAGDPFHGRRAGD